MITRFDHLDERRSSEVLALIDIAAKYDGVPPVAEHVLLHLRHGGDIADTHFVAEVSGVVVGYAHLDLTDQVEGASAEIVVHPEHRGRSIGSQLIEEVRANAGKSLRLWSHGDLPGAQKIASAHGFQRERTVIQMVRTLDETIPEPDSSIAIRSFLTGVDNAEWIALNNTAFASHPEQSDWSERDLEIRTKESWFDPHGFLIAEESGVMSGFCWTKIHGGHTHQHSPDESAHDHDPIGEIYIMGVNPTFQGRGIGRSVTLAGLKYLRYQGLSRAMLYVDADNKSAITLYSSLGFVENGRDVMYRYTLSP